MLKNGLLAVFSLVIGFILILGDFHFYVMLLGGAFTTIGTIFVWKFNLIMIQKMLEKINNRR
jgi:hypothetical protein